MCIRVIDRFDTGLDDTDEMSYQSNVCLPFPPKLLTDRKSDDVASCMLVF